jgi:hypothetical protein
MPLRVREHAVQTLQHDGGSSSQRGSVQIVAALAGRTQLNQLCSKATENRAQILLAGTITF